MKFIPFFLSLLLVIDTSALRTTTQKATSSFDSAERTIVALSIRQAVQAATTIHPSVKSADIDIEMAGISEKAAWSGYLPAVTVSTSMYGDKKSGTSQLNATIAGNQYLIGFAGPKQVAQQAAVDKKIATINKDTTLQQRRALTENLFLTSWLKQEEENCSKCNFEQAKTCSIKQKESLKLVS